jgi:hypothetical protein
MTRACGILALVAVLLGGGSGACLATEKEAPPDPWLTANVFVGYDGCLAMWGAQELALGESLLLFEEGRPLRMAHVFDRFSGERANEIFERRRFQGVYRDSALWDSIGCYWGIRAAQPAAVARWAPDGREDGLHLAIRGLPREARVAGGAGRWLRASELSRLVDGNRSKIPSKFTHSSVLRAGVRFPSGGGPELTRLFLGRAFFRSAGTGAPIDSVQICTVYLAGDRVLATSEFSRISGEMERAETEPPQLDRKNWYDVQSQTIGFMSIDGGATWRHVTVDVGFEGIWWAIWELSADMPLLWDRYVYTIH